MRRHVRGGAPPPPRAGPANKVALDPLPPPVSVGGGGSGAGRGARGRGVWERRGRVRRALRKRANRGGGRGKRRSGGGAGRAPRRRLTSGGGGAAGGGEGLRARCFRGEGFAGLSAP